MKLQSKHLGCKVKLSNGVTGHITIFDGSKMPVYVKHDKSIDQVTFGTWHLEDGTSYGVKDFDIIEIIDTGESFKKTKKEEECTHKWKFYHGLIESYDYCIYCDKKR